MEFLTDRHSPVGLPQRSIFALFQYQWIPFLPSGQRLIEKRSHVSLYKLSSMHRYWALLNLYTSKDTDMNLDGLTPEQVKLIFNLSKRIEILESRLGHLQEKLVRVDRVLTIELAQSFKYINLN